MNENPTSSGESSSGGIGIASSIGCAILSAIMCFTLDSSFPVWLLILHLLPFVVLLFSSSESKILRGVFMGACILWNIFLFNVFTDLIGEATFLQILMGTVLIIGNLASCILLIIFKKSEYKDIRCDRCGGSCKVLRSEYREEEHKAGLVEYYCGFCRRRGVGQ